ncbi:MAG: LysR family transcriptional regulator [Firmicutes bacterium]|nr:LysR family transcriptional regulator [Bacillota bacterium]
MLYIFCSVVENNGFRNAAEKLLISQSSVSTAIKALENELEAKLIKRRVSNNDNMELTEAGKCFYFTAKEILKLKDSLYQNIRNLKKEEAQHKETVSIITNAALGGHLLPKLLERFKLNFDKLYLKIIIETNDYSSMADLFKNNACDIGIIPLDINAPFTNLVFTFEQRLSIVANKKIVISSYEDFEKLPLVLLPKSFISRKALDDFFLRNQIMPNIALELNYPYVIKELIKKENFVAILHYVTVKEEINRGELIEIIPSFELPTITYKLVVNQKSTKQKYLDEITNFLSVLKTNSVV